MKVIFCIPGANFSRKWVECWTQLLIYCMNSGIQFTVSLVEFSNIYMTRAKCLGADVMRGINQKPFDGKVDYDYLFWIDSDQVFTPAHFQRLINHGENIVSAIIAVDGGHALACGKWDEDFFKINGYMPHLTPETINSEPKNAKGLIELDYCGFGFLAVKYGVFESIEYPWFEPFITDLNGIKDFSTEDVSFCKKAQKIGYKIYVDPLVRVGHEKKIIY